MIILGLLAKEGVAAMSAADLGHPQIARTSIKNHFKRLWRITNRNSAVVLRIGIILDDFILFFFGGEAKISTRNGGAFVVFWEGRESEQGFSFALQVRQNQLFIRTFLQVFF